MKDSMKKRGVRSATTARQKLQTAVCYLYTFGPGKQAVNVTSLNVTSFNLGALQYEDWKEFLEEANQ
jgi:hypothetical protein